jgi:hypothetical protein
LAALSCVLSGAAVACVYSSDAPTPNSSGATLATSQDGTDPGGDNGGSTVDASGGGTGAGKDAGGDKGTGSDSGSSQGSDASTTGTDSGGPTAPTWTEIYTGYFAASSLGRCGSSGCHSSSRGGFKCGSDKDTCYQGLVTAGYVDATNGAQSAIADKTQTCLSWFGGGGNMPGGSANAKAAADISAWVQAGAQDN